jgi:hypothetical protein
MRQASFERPVAGLMLCLGTESLITLQKLWRMAAEKLPASEKLEPSWQKVPGP